MTPLPNNHYAIEVPEGARSFQIDNDMGQKVIWKEGEYGVSDEWVYEKLPPGPWQYLCLASQAGEEVARGIVEEYIIETGWSISGKSTGEFCLYMNYEIERPVPIAFLKGNAIDSLSSLLRSLDLKSEAAILKRVKS
jgi:hypothetical protein